MLKAKQDGNRGHHTGSSKKGQCKITWCAVRQWRWCRVHIWWEHIHLAELWYLVPGIITQGICAPQFFVSLKSGSDWCCWLLILIQSLCWNSTWSPGWLPIDSNSISKQWEQQVQFLLSFGWERKPPSKIASWWLFVSVIRYRSQYMMVWMYKVPGSMSLCIIYTGTWKRSHRSTWKKFNLLKNSKYI